MNPTDPVSPRLPPFLVNSGAHVRRGAVAVVGHRLDDHRHAIGAVALIADFFVFVAIARLRFLDRAVDHILRHRIRLGFFHRQPQTWVFVGVGVAHFCCDGDFFGQFGEQLGAQGVLPPLAVLDLCPF